MAKFTWKIPFALLATLGIAAAAPADEAQDVTNHDVVAAGQQKVDETPDTGGRLEISTMEWDFGEVWQGEAVSHAITVKNVGTGPLLIDVRSSCGCTVPTKPKSPLPAGESDTMTISYNTLKRRGPANQTVTISTNDPSKKLVQVRVKGEVKQLVLIEPQDGIYFGQLFEHSRETKSVKLKPQFNETINLTLKPDQDYSPYKVEFNEIEAGKEYELIATTEPPLELNGAGLRKEITLLTGLDRISEIKIPVHAVVQPPVQVRPTRLYVPKNVKSAITRVIRISYLPEQPIKVTEVTCNVPTIKAELAPDKPAAAANLTVAYHEIKVTLPVSEGLPDDGATITIKTDSSDARYQVFEIPVKVVARADASAEPLPAEAQQRMQATVERNAGNPRIRPTAPDKSQDYDRDAAGQQPSTDPQKQP